MHPLRWTSSSRARMAPALGADRHGRRLRRAAAGHRHRRNADRRGSRRTLRIGARLPAASRLVSSLSDRQSAVGLGQLDADGCRRLSRVPIDGFGVAGRSPRRRGQWTEPRRRPVRGLARRPRRSPPSGADPRGSPSTSRRAAHDPLARQRHLDGRDLRAHVLQRGAGRPEASPAGRARVRTGARAAVQAGDGGFGRHLQRRPSRRAGDRRSAGCDAGRGGSLRSRRSCRSSASSPR